MEEKVKCYTVYLLIHGYNDNGKQKNIYKQQFIAAVQKEKKHIRNSKSHSNSPSNSYGKSQ